MEDLQPYRVPTLLLNVAKVTLAVLLCVYATMDDLANSLTRARHRVAGMSTDEVSATLERAHRDKATLKFVNAGASIVKACVPGWITGPRRQSRL